MNEQKSNEPIDEDVQGHAPVEQPAESAESTPESDAKVDPPPDDEDTEGHRIYSSSNVNIKYDVRPLT